MFEKYQWVINLGFNLSETCQLPIDHQRNHLKKNHY
jgi:hypothetical protein